MEVEWVDQQNINEFSKLNSRLTELEVHESSLNQLKEDLNDLEMEIELVDEDDKLMYRLGDTFVYLPQSEIMKKIEEQRTELESELETQISKKSDVQSKMDDLKAALYAKFGKDTINLERD